MPNVLQNTLDSIRQRVRTRFCVMAIYVGGYVLLWSVNWKLAVGVYAIILTDKVRL